MFWTYFLSAHNKHFCRWTCYPRIAYMFHIFPQFGYCSSVLLLHARDSCIAVETRSNCANGLLMPGGGSKPCGQCCCKLGTPETSAVLELVPNMLTSRHLDPPEVPFQICVPHHNCDTFIDVWVYLKDPGMVTGDVIVVTTDRLWLRWYVF